MSVRQLTKSRFKVGFDCPTKLYFLDNPTYGNTNGDNSFLMALAEGGFQVGELAKVYFTGGHEIKTLEKTEALRQTAELLKNKSVIIFEAAIQHENLFIRADILVKRGNKLELIEVKAKSYDPREENQFYTKSSLKKGPKKICSAWEPYLIDVAFQCHVLKAAFPEAQVTGALMLADKSATASVDGMNQKFSLSKADNGRTYVKVSEDLKSEQLGKQLLICVGVDEQVDIINSSIFELSGKAVGFKDLIENLAKICAERIFAPPIVGSQCKGCEFRIGDELKSDGKKSGFEQCWSQQKKLKPADFKRPFVFDIWNFRRSLDLIDSGKLFIDQVEEEDIAPKHGQDGLSSSERQWLQVEKIKMKDSTPFIDVVGIASEFKNLKYPLHFIDFETTMVAIPFHKGRHPYEQIAFQFSHHTVSADGTITHSNEYINREKGKFPNFDFVRALKRALDKDEGTIFRYAAHENTVLSQIKKQLISANEPMDDLDELVSFIESITSFSNEKGQAVVGNRCMLDLCDLVKKYYYHPMMKGSNSIKKVLPAILNASNHLKEKYSKPIYGSASGIKSHNFADWIWIRINQVGEIEDPYKRLPPVFNDLELAEMDALLTEGSIADGGAAMTAYSRMQFTEMTDGECKRVCDALLKYCELDTFAMVLIWEYWKQEIELSQRKAA
jgi:hypothetical protein